MTTYFLGIDWIDLKTKPPLFFYPKHPSQGFEDRAQWILSHLWQRHAVDDEVWLLVALPSERMLIAMVWSCISWVLVFHVEEGALGAPAAQRQALLVVVEVVERRGERWATHHIHLVCLLHVSWNQADVVLAQLLLLAGLLLVAIWVLRHPAQVEETEQTQ